MYLYRYQSKAPDINDIKPGSVLIAQKIFGNELMDRSVILILEHDETGSTGVILNKSNFFSRSLSALSNRNIGYGGNYDPHRMGFIHPIKNISRAIKISDDLYFSENSSELESLMYGKDADNLNIKMFVGFTVWDSGQLEQEITDQKWRINDFKLNELHSGDNQLWGHKLLKAGNIYGLFYNLPDPFSN